MSPFLILTGLVFFLLGGLALALPWGGVVALLERAPERYRPGAEGYVFLLVAPVVLLLAVVVIVLGPWEPEVCRALQDACLEQVTTWQLPAWVGMGLGATGLVVGGRALKPFLARRRQRIPAPVLSGALAAKWEAVRTEIARLCGTEVPSLYLVQAPLHACYLEGPFPTRLVISEAVLQTLEPDELVGAMAHELAHLRRNDLWWGPLAFLCYCLSVFMPVSHRCYSGYLAARERAADDWAIARTGRPLTLASALGKVRRLAEGSPVVGGRVLAGRLQRLLGGERPSATRTPGTAVVSLLLAVVVLPLMAPTLAELHHLLEPLGRGVLSVLGIVS